VAEGARRMLATALEAEVDGYVSSFVHELDEQGHRLVVRNGHAVAQTLVTGAGPIEVRVPRVDDRRVDEATGEKLSCRSSILPPWARKSPKGLCCVGRLPGADQPASVGSAHQITIASSSKAAASVMPGSASIPSS
jgi:hypothetical protein